MKRLILVGFVIGCGHDRAVTPVEVVAVPALPASSPSGSLPSALQDEPWNGESVSCAPSRMGESVPDRSNLLGDRMPTYRRTVTTRVRRLRASSADDTLARAVDDADYDTSRCESNPGATLDIAMKLTVEGGRVTSGRTRGVGSVGAIPKCLLEVACGLPLPTLSRLTTVIVPLRVRPIAGGEPRVTPLTNKSKAGVTDLAELFREAGAACEQGELVGKEARWVDIDASVPRGFVRMAIAGQSPVPPSDRIVSCLSERVQAGSYLMDASAATRLRITWQLDAP